MAIYNWYHGTPTDSSPAPDPAPAPDPVADAGTAQPPESQFESGRPDGRPLNIHKFAKGTVQKDGTYKRQFTVVNDLSGVKYSSLGEYLKAENLGDRSGFFSGTDFSIPYDSTKARAMESTVTSIGPLLLSPIAGSFGGSQAVMDPTGMGSRYIPLAGGGNALASMVIDEEYRELFKIKQFRNDAANIGKDGGFVMNVGGLNIYRRPGSVQFRGQLDRLGLDQQGAKQLEIFSTGIANGQQVANGLLSGEGVSQETIANIGDGRVILETVNGGYFLNGNFHYGTGTAAGGYMEDLEALAMSMFSANGQLTLPQAKVFASSWKNSASSMSGFSGRNATTQELIDNLQSFQQKASDYASSLSSQKEDAAQAKANTFIDNVMAGNYENTKYNETIAEEFAESGRVSDETMDNVVAESRRIYDQMADDIATSYSDFTADDFDFGYAAGGEVPEDDFDNFISGNEMIQSEGDESGFVGRPPSQVTDAESVADDKEMVAKEEGMVLNAEAVKLAGEQDVAAMIKEADDYLRKNGEEVEDTREATNIRISEGEVYISPRHADVIGRSRLRKINDRGIPKTEEKLQKAAKGGDIGYATGDEVQGFLDQPGEIADTGDAPRMKAEIPPGDIDLFKKFAAIKGQPKRAAVENLIDNLSDVGKLALLIVTETTALADPIESMEAVGQVAVNRMNTNDPDFDDVNSIVDVLKQRSNRGTGSKMFQFDGLEPSTVKARAKDLTGNVGPMALDKIYSAAQNVIDMNPRLGGDNRDGREPAIPLSVLYYKKPGSTGGNFMDERHFFEPYTTIGGHQFYNVNFEFPGKASGRIRYK
tara:strand:- start:45 stop:2504 length:2460 start_codon:yes stop_codon:yes gene_type:complete